MAARAALERARARLGVATCDFRHADRVHRFCAHLQDGADVDFRRYFTGQGIASELRCIPCCDEGASPDRVESCAACFERAERVHTDIGFEGTPGVLERPSSLRLERSSVDLGGVGTAPIVALAPVPGAPRWIAVLADSSVRAFDAASGAELSAVFAPLEGISLDGPVVVPSRRGDLVAIASRTGRTGAVVAVATGEVLLRLHRGDYHEEHCRFSVAFFEHGGRTLLAHATDWNRLDLTDPRSGERLSERTFEPLVPGGRETAHALDYFHCGLHVSPDDRWIVDDGWIWHPVGSLRAWSLERWVSANPFESEDGPTVKELCQRTYFWDGPVAWVAPRKLAVFGYGHGDDLLPAALVFDVETGVRERWFAGPRGEFFADGPWLVSAHSEETSVWDLATGERVLRVTDFTPTHYHPATRQLAALDGRALRVATLAGEAPQSSSELSAG